MPDPLPPPLTPADVDRLADLGYTAGYVRAIGDITDVVSADLDAGIEPSLPRLLAHLRTLSERPPRAVPQ